MNNCYKLNDENLKKIILEKIFHRDGTEAPELINVILQNNITKDVLYGASMSKETLKETMEIGYVVLYSRSRKCRWFKGETSGNKLKVVSIYLNCDNDQLRIMVEPEGEGVCHEKDEHGKYRPTCFFKPVLTLKAE